MTSHVSKSPSPISVPLQGSSSRRSASSNREHFEEISLQPHDDESDFDSDTKRRSLSRSRDDEPDPLESIQFSQVIEEIFNLLPSDRFPKEADSSIPSSSSIPRPKSSIEEELVSQERRSISLPQSQIVQDTMNYIQDQIKKDQYPEDWIVRPKDQKRLVNMTHYKSHNDKVPTSREVPLDPDAGKLKLGLSGKTQIPVKSLNSWESQLRDLLRVLSHADIFSYAAFKCLFQEKIDPAMLKRILKSLALSINHSVSLASYLTTEVLQARREAAIHSAPKSLSDIAKNQLRSVPIVSDSLFGGKVNEIYKENAETLTNDLISNTVTSSHQRSKSSFSNKRPTFKKPQPKNIGSRQAPKVSDSRPPRKTSGFARGGTGSFRGSFLKDRPFPSRGRASSSKRH